MEKILSEAFLNKASIEELTVVHNYLLSRHTYLMKYEIYDLLEPIADSMDEIQKVIFSRISSPDFGNISKYQP